MTGMTSDRRKQFRHALLEWYRAHHRALPWRVAPAAAGEPARFPDPYHVLVSEAMLQQTRVATVVDYFERFIREFETVEALAAADEQRVLRLWQGLGYYRRARHLHAAAREIVAEHGGRVPDRVEVLRKLPGVGPYTAGAVASIAYGRRAAAVDGNVARVLARLFTIDGPVNEPPVRRRLWELAEGLLPGGADAGNGGTPGDFNQAVMELGARICTPRAPRCSVCPVGGWCEASARGDAERWPVNGVKAAPRPVTHRIVSVRRGERRLFVCRPDDGLWAGLWEQPTLEGDVGRADDPSQRPSSGGRASARGLRPWVRRRLGLEIGRCAYRGTFEHMTTHRRVRFEVWEAAVEAGRLRKGAGEWRRIDRVDDLPLSNPQRRALRMLARVVQAN